MEPITTINGKAVALPIENIDTDQVIPASYLKVTDKAGLAEGLFQAWRYLPDGSLNPDFALNRPEALGATILVAGRNFGCGSSREHAPWALQGYGFRAVVAPAFADIFRNNALKIGLLPVTIDEESYHELLSHIEEDPATMIEIDLPNQRLIMPGGRAVPFPIDGFARHCLVHGVDQLGFLQQQEDAIAAFESQHAVAVNTLQPN
ncbi:3-isopropylmalate dehydratase small subunit [Candidatus Viridilinea mediisalina]|uniref:3-isopropylmalate dehydratase small subunit n=1 Tax=Candidatus Viridilinea mediisalina TaxID=2024553 RepID=A0A2A6RNK7_9CHLR|nr:3-isopropylmalate dehydratase small subunit [Candidatus Viridilinea mediisalina]PDW04505.1 3-isopropylmalate dehydratase small subunit [Candidatus Viridilinea mediisalina]